VLYLPGNHEYYMGNQRGKKKYQEVQKELQRVCSLSPKLVYLDKQSVKISGVRVIGATLWTHVPAYAEIAASLINDYNLILRDPFPGEEEMGYSPISIRDTNAWHDESLYFVAEEISHSVAFQERNCVVLSHHSPTLTGTSSPQYEGPFTNKTNHAFGTNLEHMFKDYGRNGNSNLHTWCFGHTHFSCDFVRHGTRVVSNQRGYPREMSSSKLYKNDFVINVPIM